MLWAQITILVLTGVGLLISANEHGKPKTGTNSFPLCFVCSIIAFLLHLFAGPYSRIF